MRTSSEFGQLVSKLKTELGSFGKLSIKTNVSKAYLLEMTQGKVPGAEYVERIAEQYPEHAEALFSAAGYTLPDRFRVEINSVRIPVLGVIRAGAPILAAENIEDYEFATPDEAANGEYFYLRVAGDSMNNADIREGYLVFVRKQNDVDSHDIAIVMVDGENATIKRVIKTDDGIILQPESSNSAHIPLRFRHGDDFKIIGKVLHVKFKVGC